MDVEFRIALDASKIGKYSGESTWKYETVLDAICSKFEIDYKWRGIFFNTIVIKYTRRVKDMVYFLVELSLNDLRREAIGTMIPIDRIIDDIKNYATRD